MKVYTKQLTKRHWDSLREYGLIDAGEGNGFANTTKLFDKEIGASSIIKYVVIKRTVYLVQYVSGCFYPVWTIFDYTTNFKPYEAYVVSKHNDEITITTKTIGA
ncbi:hypothetical protein MA9V1_128 [Chryseobacterium phage MA9V-1]|nr:hypothetical protein MA9V1_128 [Chryseobacterium phage MA9V-1]